MYKGSSSAVSVVCTAVLQNPDPALPVMNWFLPPKTEIILRNNSITYSESDPCVLYITSVLLKRSLLTWPCSKFCFDSMQLVPKFKGHKFINEVFSSPTRPLSV